MKEKVEQLLAQCAQQKEARKQLALNFQDQITKFTGTKPETKGEDDNQGMGKKSNRPKK